MEQHGVRLVYKATVLPKDKDPKIRIGMTEHDFKSGFRTHKLSFNNKKYSAITARSTFDWELKESNTEYSIKWSIVKHV